MSLLNSAAPLVLLKDKPVALLFYSAAESQYLLCIAAEAECSQGNFFFGKAQCIYMIESWK